MQVDPVLEWQQLTEHYRQMSDDELRYLACDFADLTETAKQALRGEMRSRGLGDPESMGSVAALQSAPRDPSQAPVTLRNAPWAGDPTDIAFGALDALAPEPVPDASDTGDKTAGPHDYTWKTTLCECYSHEEATQLQEALRRAGIESWFNVDGGTYTFVPPTAYRLGIGGIRVLVAADQLEQARAIAAKPIPQDIVDDSKVEVPEYEVPKCPKCHAEDPVLDSVDPVNTWHCEQCGAEWSDSPGTGAAGSPENR